MDVVARGYIQTVMENCTMEEYEKLKRLVESASEDIAKAEGGNKAAGTRVRKMMQDIKAAAQEVRKKILESRSSQTTP
jgi:succinate dehydrogenase flavin-adding protein (antitoxin of CptAB toxin-antitoxin module)